MSVEGDWLWADCSTPNPWQESLWSPGEPDGATEDCGALLSDGTLGDYVCDSRQSLICELQPKGDFVVLI